MQETRAYYVLSHITGNNDAMGRLFEGSFDPKRLLRGISAEMGQQILPETTLVVLDEVQAVPRALTSLKHFCEDAPEYAIVVAGSPLGVALNAGMSFPVGKVAFLGGPSEALWPLLARNQGAGMLAQLVLV